MRRSILSLVAASVLLAAAPCAADAQVRKSPRLARLEARLLALQMKGSIYPSVKAAEAVYQQRRKELGEEHAETTAAMQTLAGACASTGDHVHATRLYQELLRRAERKHGADAPETASAVEQLASGFWVAQRLDAAELQYQRSLAIRKKIHGEDSPLYAMYLQIYAGLLSGRSAFSAAEDIYRQVRRIHEKADKDSPQLIGVLFGLGWVYLSSGQERRGKEAFDRALAISDKSYASAGEWAAQAQAGMLLGVASMYSYAGREDLARPLASRGESLYRDEIARLERKDPNDARLSGMLGGLGGMYQRAGDLAGAEAMYRRAIAIDERQASGSPLAGVAWLSSLAMVQRDQGKPREAIALFGKMRAIYARQMGERSAGFLDAMIADVHREMGDYPAAERLLGAMVARMARSYGRSHSMVGTYLESLAAVEMASGKPRRALATLERALDIAEPALAVILAAGTEHDHAAYFHRVAHQLHMAVTLNVRFAASDGRATRLALVTALRRKGRILDAAASTVAILRGKLSAGDRDLLDELAAARGQLAKLILGGPEGDPDEYAQLIVELETTVRRFEDQMRRKSSAYRISSQPIELRTVQAAIPEGGALVEIVSYKAFDPGAIGKARFDSQRRYAAYILRRKGDPVLVELGDGTVIDQAARQFLEAVSDPDRDDVGAIGRVLYGHTLGKLAAKLGSVKQLFIAPDGALNLVPFGALTDETGGFLIARYPISYLTSGRDLLRLGPITSASQGAVIIADPAFGTAAGSPDAGGGDGKAARGRAGGAPSRGRRSRDFRGQAWKPLPGTAQEAAALQKVLAGAVVLEGARATEDALKRVKGPRILHIATHGFFMESEEPAAAAAAARLPVVAGMPIVALPRVETGAENPLLRSGLALAGANRLASGEEDGVLTAMEAAGLDLAGTGLVVLSACETGVGKATDGDGVHGLRRAFVIAGARTLVMSLWQVDDAATRDLMTGFYRRLGNRQGPSAALRSIQLELAASQRHAHPYYWASFVPAGDFRPLEEK